MEALEGKRWDASLEYGVLKSRRTMIHPSFFEHFSTLKILDLSRTNIQSVPPFISMLGSLVNLTLQECSMLVELPPEIGTLSNLMIFDLEGTEIMYLPKEMGKLTNLQCLRVSLSAYADEYIGRNGIENVIPRTTLSKLSKLEELSIHVNQDAKWWEVELLEAILEKLHLLTCLKILKLYLPTAQALLYFLRLHSCQPPIYSTLQDFNLQIGHGEQLTSCLKTNLVKCFEMLEKCLKYENGEEITDDIKELVGYAKALFMCRHWTIEKLSIFDISRLKYCLLAECNEMHTIVDADELQGDKSATHNNVVREAFASLEYLAIHSMKKLQSIWKGPLSRDSFSCLQVLALHTCPELTTVFTEGMLYGLHSLTALIVEDCAKVNSLVSRGSTHENYGPLFPNLRRILVLDLPELVSISNGACIAPHLDTLLIFNCLKLDYLSPMELSRNVKVIKGETEWWDALKSVEGEYSSAFVPLERDGELMNQLAEDTNSLKNFHRLKRRGEAASISSSTFVPPDSQVLPAQVYETKKDLDWGLFVHYLKYQKPPVSLSQCKSGHVIKFLKYLNKFGDIRVHMEGCVLFGQPYPSATCFCPLREAWGTLEEIVTRLHASYAVNVMPEMNPFSSRDIDSYLNQVRKSQEIALGVPCKKPEFSILTVEEKSEFGCSSPIILSPTKGMINSGGQGGHSTGTRTETSTKLPVPVQEAIGIISKWNSNTERRNQDNDTGGLDWYLEAIDRIRYWLNSAAATDDLSMAANAMELAMHRLIEEFRTILQVNCISKEHSSSDSYHELQEDDYVKSYGLSPKVISDLRNMAVRAISDEHIQILVAIYISERGKYIRSRCQQFIFHKWSRNDAQRFHWELLESLIVNWIKMVKIFLEGLFASEKQWCEHIFQGLGTNIGDICYELTIHFYETQVFNIVYALSYCYPPPDRLFTILDLYHTLDRFLSEIYFVAKPSELNHGTHLLHLLADKITSNLSKFEMALLYHESLVIFVGPVDPFPVYVLSYLYKLCEHKHAFKKITLPKLPSIDEGDLMSIYYEEFEGRSELSCHVIWIIMRLVSNLEGQAKLCADGSAGCFFAMKNIHYIVQKIEGRPELMEVIGNDYLGKLIQKLDQTKVKYLTLELEKIRAVRDYLKV